MTFKSEFKNKVRIDTLSNHDLFEANGNQYIVVEDKPTYFDLNYYFVLMLNDEDNNSLVVLRRDVMVTLLKKNATMIVE